MDYKLIKESFERSMKEQDTNDERDVPFADRKFDAAEEEEMTSEFDSVTAVVTPKMNGEDGLVTIEIKDPKGAFQGDDMALHDFLEEHFMPRMRDLFDEADIMV